MLKLRIKKTKEGRVLKYQQNKSNTIEHLFAIAKLYQKIRENQPDVTNEEMHEIVMGMLEKLEEN